MEKNSFKTFVLKRSVQNLFIVLHTINWLSLFFYIYIREHLFYNTAFLIIIMTIAVIAGTFFFLLTKVQLRKH